MVKAGAAEKTGSVRVELAEIGRSITSTDFASGICNNGDGENDELRLQWAAVERLPTLERITTALFTERDEAVGKGNERGRRVVDVRKLAALERHLFVEKLIKHVENDNLRLMQNIRKRIDEVGIELSTVEVRFKSLAVEADCDAVRGKPLPSLLNAVTSFLSGLTCSKQKTKISILKDVSGIIKPGRLTLLLGPPGCGKTTLLLALSGRLGYSLKAGGEVCYNGYRLEEFVPEKTSSYVSQNDLHIPELSVRETLDFSACCQGTGSRAEIMKEISRKEKLAGIVPDPDIDAYTKAVSIDGLKNSLQTDYVMKILGLDICADTRVGNAMRRGISGGQKKRLTTGEMIVGPIRALFMDEISNGLDSSTTFQIVSCLHQFAQIGEATILISLLQPAPETFALFDDLILMGEGKIMYHGPRAGVCRFFEDCGFRCPDRKDVASFLQEVISRNDQQQYWHRADTPYSYVSVDEFVEKFRESDLGLRLEQELSKPLDRSPSHKNALCFRKYSLSKWAMLKACSRRELLLMKRNYFIYVVRAGQLLFSAFVLMTVFLRTGSTTDALHANHLMSSLFQTLFSLFLNGVPERAFTLSRLPVFCKQKELHFYPAWAYAIPSAIVKVPLSLVQAFIWTLLTYYAIDYSPGMRRFFQQFLILFALHLASLSMYRALAAVFSASVFSTVIGSGSLMFLLLFGGFIVPKSSMPAWLRWGFWLSPLSYAEIGLTTNEFLAPRWTKVVSGNFSLGEQVLDAHGLGFGSDSYWMAFSSLIGFTLFYNVVFALALTFLSCKFLCHHFGTHIVCI